MSFPSRHELAEEIGAVAQALRDERVKDAGVILSRVSARLADFADDDRRALGETIAGLSAKLDQVRMDLGVHHPQERIASDILGRLEELKSDLKERIDMAKADTIARLETSTKLLVLSISGLGALVIALTVPILLKLY